MNHYDSNYAAAHSATRGNSMAHSLLESAQIIMEYPSTSKAWQNAPGDLIKAARHLAQNIGAIEFLFDKSAKLIKEQAPKTIEMADLLDQLEYALKHLRKG